MNDVVAGPGDLALTPWDWSAHCPYPGSDPGSDPISPFCLSKDTGVAPSVLHCVLHTA